MGRHPRPQRLTFKTVAGSRPTPGTTVRANRCDARARTPPRRAAPVAWAPLVEGLLGRLSPFRGLPRPGFQWRSLEAPAVGEAELPGRAGRRGALRLMASRFTVASSSGWPPDRKTIPGTAAGTALLKQAMVFSATSWGPPPGRPRRRPTATMLGFSRMPSRATRWLPELVEGLPQGGPRWRRSSDRCRGPPSMSTSGSTMGTSPACWLRAANRARAWALTSMQWALGDTGSDGDDGPATW